MTAARVAWTAAGTLLALPALTFGTANVVSAIAHRQETVVRTFDTADIAALDVDGEGRVIVVGADVDEVTVTMRVSHGLRRTGHTEEVVGDTLVLRATCPLLSTYCQVDHTVEVPRHVDVTVDGTNDRLVITDIDGRVQVDNDSGPIELARLTGDLVADNDNGRITGTELRSSAVVVGNDHGRIELEFLDPPDRVVVDNENGSIEIVVPDIDEGYAVDATTDNGSTDVRVRTDFDSPRSITATNNRGSITIRPL